MKRSMRSHLSLLLTAAGLTIVSLTIPAAAQFPAQGQDGHANDANNRVGSNGYNTPASSSPGVTGNQIINKQVTGGRGFRGPVPYREPGAFMGPVPEGLNDAIVRNSAGVPTQFGPPSDLTQPRPFYGDARAIPPPPGSIPVGFNGGYVGTNLSSPSSLSAPMYAPLDYSLQARVMAPTTFQENLEANPFTFQNALPQPGQESFYNSGALTVSPLFGIRPAGMNAGSPWNTTPNGLSPGAGDRFRMQESAVQAMQREMMEAAGVRPQGNRQGTPEDNGAQPENQNPLVQPLDRPLESPENGPLLNRPMSSALNNTQGLNSSINTGASLRQALTVPPALQSSQYSALQQRLKQYAGVYGQSDEEANSVFQRAAAAAQQRTQVPLPNQPALPGAPRPKATAPLKIDSLATGIPAKGLHDLLANAEEQMRQDKFTAALEQYDRARRVAPNNPMIQLGRGIAQLGAGYYAQADRDIRLAYSSGPALMMAQLDLTKMLSQQRLQFLNNDLANLANHNPQDPRPWFLQAFIAYNTGDAQKGLADLQEAQSRGSRADATIRALQAYWSLAEKAGPTTQSIEPQRNTAPQTQPSELNK